MIDAGKEDVAEALGRAHGTRELFGWPVVGTQLFYEVSGAPPVLPLIVGVATFHARAVVVAVDWKMVLGKEMTITSSTTCPEEFPEVIAARSDPGFDTGPLVSHAFPLDRFGEALEAARDRENSSKILIYGGD